MRSLKFTLNTQTGDDAMAPATVTISETADGSLTFAVSNVGDGDTMIGDIRALFFDVSDDSLLQTLTVNGEHVTEVVQDGEVSNLGGGATSNGVPDSPYEVGIEFGTSGMSTDDLQTVSFSLSSTSRALTLDDIALESFTVRQTSVGEDGGARDASDKLYGDAPYPVDAVDDTVSLSEDEVSTSNVFANDIDEDAGDLDLDGVPDGLTVTAVNGDAAAVGDTFALGDGITATLDGDGSLTVDATDADYLSVGETVSYTLDYAVDDGNGGSDSATVAVTVTGVNDDPTANPDFASTDEASAVSGNVLENDSDVDRLDSISVLGVNGDTGAVGSEISLDSGALLTLRADGTFDYDPNGAFGDLNDGESALDVFTYSISDGNGGIASSTASITVAGVGGGGGGIPDGDHFGVFLNKKATAAHEISNVVFYLQDDDDVIKVKMDDWSGVTDLDSVELESFLQSEFAGDTLLAVSIKAGNNHNADLGPGEGQLFLLDGDEDIDYVAAGDVPDGLTQEILAAHADKTYSFEDGWFI